MVLLRGSCIANEALLTGESMPQMKEPVQSLAGEAAWKEPLGEGMKIHMLFGGTKIMTVTKDDDVKPRLPEEGCLCYVVRTGFNTTQGQLMRTILFAAEAVTANTKESFLFILCLLVWGIGASIYVLHRGLQDPDRSRYKLMLNCIMIITSVVPPELPMELSLAVNNSLIALMGCRVFCTEPFRIPLAGKVDVCCFDKTGTLTSDDIIMQGCVLKGEDNAVHNPLDLPLLTNATLAGCSSLVHVDGELVGNATEKAALEAIEWTMGNGGKVAMSTRGKKINVEILRRFHFSSGLKRMSTIVNIDGHYHVLAKGAPEVLSSLMKDAPEGFEEIHQRYSRRGLRVLALATKPIEASKPSEIQGFTREDAEQGLSYLGLALFRCPLKSDSRENIVHLREGAHQVMMITGDHALTACHVAKELKMTAKPESLRAISAFDQDLPLLLLSGKPDNGAAWEWEDVATGREKRVFSEEGIPQLASTHALCLDGAAIASLEAMGLLPSVVLHVTVWARTSPRQKERIVQCIKSQGKAVLMCGDGTNDVGALKAAEVGVGLINVSAVKASLQAPVINAKMPLHEQMRLQAEAEERARTPNFGDASIASPFTAKRPSIMACIDVIRQGRCTLVSTMQMFKILGINCLVSAYCLSVLFMDGLKWGDTQMTLQGLCVAGFFFFISRAKPMRKLSPQRPPSNVFSPYMVVSIVIQMLIHLYVLVESVSLVKNDPTWAEMAKVNLEDDFKPSLFNTVVYLMYSTILLSIFTVNYSGHPHMQSLYENKAMLYGILFNWGVNIALTLGNPWLTEMFELVPLPAHIFYALLQLMVIDFFATLVVEKMSSVILHR